MSDSVNVSSDGTQSDSAPGVLRSVLMPGKVYDYQAQQWVDDPSYTPYQVFERGMEILPDSSQNSNGDAEYNAGATNLPEELVQYILMEEEARKAKEADPDKFKDDYWFQSRDDYEFLDKAGQKKFLDAQSSAYEMLDKGGWSSFGNNVVDDISADASLVGRVGMNKVGGGELTWEEEFVLETYRMEATKALHPWASGTGHVVGYGAVVAYSVVSLGSGAAARGAAGVASKLTSQQILKLVRQRVISAQTARLAANVAKTNTARLAAKGAGVGLVYGGISGASRNATDFGSALEGGLKGGATGTVIGGTLGAGTSLASPYLNRLWQNTLKPRLPIANRIKPPEKTSSAVGANAAQVGEPVSVATGEYLETWNDFSIPGLLALVGSRYMGLKMPMDWCGPLGYCQISVIDEVVTNPEYGYLSYFDCEGHEIRFQRPFNFLPSENAAFPHLSLKAPWLKQLELKDRRTIKKFQQYPDKIYRLQSIEDLNGNRITLHRDKAGVLWRLETSDGLALVFDNDQQGKRTCVTLVGIDGSRQELARYSYDTQGRMTDAACAYGMSVCYYWHDDSNLLISWHNKTKRSETVFTYDDDGSVIHTATTGLWNNDRFEYDRKNGITKYYPAGDTSRIQQFEYDDNRNITAETNALGEKIQYKYNEAGFRIAITDANGLTSKTRYDSYGNIRQQTDAEGRTAVFGYGPNGELDKEIDAGGGVRSIVNDEYGLPVMQKDCEGNVTCYERNARGQITRTIFANGGEEHRFYDARGWLERVEDARGNTTHYAYDPYGRLAAVTNAAGGITRYAYGARAGGFNVPTKVMRPDGVIIERGFDAEGTLATITDGEGRIWRYRHGAFDVLESIEDPDGGVLKLGYDSNGNVISVTNALGRVYHLKRDAAERVVEEEDFDGRITRYERDANGQVIKLIKPDGAYLTHTYDRSGLLTEVAAFAAGEDTPSPSDVIKLRYDGNGRLKSAENGAALVTFKRDRQGRIVEENINGRRVKVRLDGIGNRIERRLFNGRDRDGEHEALHSLNYERDLAGQITRLMIGDHAPLAFEYDALGRETRRQGGKGFRLEQAHDSIGQLVKQQAGVSISAFGAGLQGMMAASHQGIEARAGERLERLFAWDKSSSPLEIADNITGKTRYAYDRRGQVKAAQSGDGTGEHFAYDSTGSLHAVGAASAGKDGAAGTFQPLLNWQSSPGGVVTLARGAHGETVRLKHDACGRVIERVVERSGFRRRKWLYEWDVFDRMVAVVTPEHERFVMGYDAFGRRLHKIRVSAAKAARQRRSSEITDEMKNRGAYYEEPKKHRFAEKNGEIIVGTSFMWDGDLMVEEAALLSNGVSDWQNATRWHYQEGTAAPLAKETPATQTSESELLYIVNDHLGTPHEMFSEAGDLLWSMRLSTWGQVKDVRKVQSQVANDDFDWLPTPTPRKRGNLALKPAAEEAAYDCPIRFQGQWHDEETGLYYNRHRYYDPLTAQYMSPDPIGLAGGTRPQAYVGNPNTQNDVFGLSASSLYRYDAVTNKYFSTKTGAEVAPQDLPWPKNDGFVDRSVIIVRRDEFVDRYGSASGRFLGRPGATASERGLVPGKENDAYSVFRVAKDFSAEGGLAAPVPEFGASGGAQQIFTGSKTVADLIKEGILIPIK